MAVYEDFWTILDAVIAVRPTRALPGSPEKVEVLTERASLRQPLWHPSDARMTDREASTVEPRRLLSLGEIA